jgi:hypothetical protein
MKYSAGGDHFCALDGNEHRLSSPIVAALLPTPIKMI